MFPAADVAQPCYSNQTASSQDLCTSTTTFRLPEDLKACVAHVAKAAGISPRSFILEAIAEKGELAEQHDAFHTLADKRNAQYLVSGESLPWQDARTWLEQRLAGKRVKRPTAKKQAR